MTQKIKYSTLGFIFGSILFLTVSTFAANGIWSVGNGFMVFKQQGDSASVNVGVGTSNPDEKLVVNGKIKSASTALSETDGQVVTTVDYVNDYVKTYFSGAQAWKVLGGNVYRDSGNVGIFENNPTEKFEVNGSARILESVKIGASDDISGSLGNNNSGIFLQSADKKSVKILNKDEKGLTVEDSGNTSVSDNFSVNGELDFGKINWNPSRNIDLVDTGEYSFDFSENTGSSEFHVTAPEIGNIFSVKSDGKASFSKSLDVDEDITTRGKKVATEEWVKANNNNGHLTSYSETDPQVGSNTTNYLSKWNGSSLVKGSIFDNGNIGIGRTPATSIKADIAGKTRIDQGSSYDIWLQGGSATSGNARNLALLGQKSTDELIINYEGEYTGGVSISSKVDVSGNIHATAFLYSSDERLKKNIVHIKNPLEKIQKIKGVTFNWRKSGKNDVGLIAQDVEKIFPEAVNSPEVGYKSVDYARIVPLLVESIKAQQDEITLLKQEIKNLKNK